MEVLLNAICWCVISFCQCFLVFKFYKRLAVIEKAVDEILTIMISDRTFQQMFEQKKTVPPIKGTMNTLKITNANKSAKKRASQSKTMKEWWKKKKAQDAENILLGPKKTEPKSDG